MSRKERIKRLARLGVDDMMANRDTTNHLRHLRVMIRSLEARIVAWVKEREQAKRRIRSLNARLKELRRELSEREDDLRQMRNVYQERFQRRAYLQITGGQS